MSKAHYHKLDANELRVIYVSEQGVREFLWECLQDNFLEFFDLIPTSGSYQHSVMNFSLKDERSVISDLVIYAQDKDEPPCPDVISVVKNLGYTTDSFFKRKSYRCLQKDTAGRYKLTAPNYTKRRRLGNEIRVIKVSSETVKTFLEQTIQKNVCQLFHAKNSRNLIICWDKETTELLLILSGTGIKQINPIALGELVGHTTDSLFRPPCFVVVRKTEEDRYVVCDRQYHQQQGCLQPIAPERLDEWLTWLENGVDSPFI